jgi:transposase
MSNPTTVTAGIDTGKHRLDIALHPGGEALQVSNDAAGWRELVAWLARHPVGRVGIEASGGYERGVVERLREAGVRVVVMQPRQVRAYATFRLRRAKNDRLDAALIAACAASLPARETAHDQRLAALNEHLRHVEQLEADLVRAKTRLETFHEPRLRRTQNREISRLDRLLKAEKASLLAAVGEHADLARRFALLQSIDGIGPRTALALLLLMPELGAMSREEAAAMAGLAPYDRDSGTYRGVRRIAGGRARVRRALYLAALPASFRWNAALRDLYGRLTDAGKPHKKALVACARKLLIFANTVLHRGSPWEKSPARS